MKVDPRVYGGQGCESLVSPYTRGRVSPALSLHVVLVSTALGFRS